jgi:hypothetical protein
VSRNLGSGNRERAHKAAGNAFAVSIGFGLVVTILGYVLLEPILRLFGATPVLLKYAREYLSVILAGSVFITFAMATNNIVRAEGRATVAMITMVLGAVANIILDPIFIFALNMGIRGAALATVIAQFLSFCFLLFFYLSGRSSLKIQLIHLKPEGSVLREIFALGVPAFIRQGGMSLVLILVNNLLGRYGGDIYISVFGGDLPDPALRDDAPRGSSTGISTDHRLQLRSREDRPGQIRRSAVSGDFIRPGRGRVSHPLPALRTHIPHIFHRFEAHPGRHAGAESSGAGRTSYRHPDDRCCLLPGCG